MPKLSQKQELRQQLTPRQILQATLLQLRVYLRKAAKVTAGNEQSAGTSRAGRTLVFVVLALLMAIPIGLSLVRWRAGRRREAAP